MITLKFGKSNKEVEAVKERLKELSLAYATEKDKALKTPILEDGDERAEGEKEIIEFLDRLEKDLHQWYYCNC